MKQSKYNAYILVIWMVWKTQAGVQQLVMISALSNTSNTLINSIDRSTENTRIAMFTAHFTACSAPLIWKVFNRTSTQLHHSDMILETAVLTKEQNVQERKWWDSLDVNTWVDRVILTNVRASISNVYKTQVVYAWKPEITREFPNIGTSEIIKILWTDKIDWLIDWLIDWCFTARQHKIRQFVPIY